jgi:2-iminobutanoate/2-iminopropanoate deaminase
MTLQALFPSGLPRPRFRYSPCVKAGPFYQVSGMLAIDPATDALEPGGPGAETRRILSNLVAALPDYGLSLADLMVARIFTTRLDLFGEINQAWEAFIAPGTVAPARTSVGVASLPIGASVEIEFGFYKD